MVSAKQVGGQRLHELARQGIEVEREPVTVTVHRFDVEPTDDPLVYRIEVECSTGTYIRSLAADLGIALGGGAHLRNLRRTAIGSFAVDDAHRIALQAAIARQARIKRTPLLAFRADIVERQAARVEEMLRGLHEFGDDE